MLQIVKEIKEGRRLTREDSLEFLLQEELEDLCKGADELRRYFKGQKANLCTIVNGKSGKCGENCKFCAQSAHNAAGAEVYDFLEPETILKDCMEQEKKGVDRYSVVTAGKGLSGQDFEKALEAYRKMSQQCKIGLCASHGILSDLQFQQLFESGVERYHCNLETSRRFFPEICTTHTYEDKIRNIKRAKEAGMEICSGGIFGMGETWQDRIDMALDLSELGVVSIPLNILMPIPGTPLEKQKRLQDEDVLRIAAIFRFLNPEADIRMAGGRVLMKDAGRKVFLSGANAAITGDMLTTTGSRTKEDQQMLRDLGYKTGGQE